jgi:hypothetical protein
MADRSVLSTADAGAAAGPAADAGGRADAVCVGFAKSTK